MHLVLLMDLLAQHFSLILLLLLYDLHRDRLRVSLLVENLLPMHVVSLLLVHDPLHLLVLLSTLSFNVAAAHQILFLDLI